MTREERYNVFEKELTEFEKFIRLLEVVTCLFIIAGVIRHWN